jgi:hypothetical protein
MSDAVPRLLITSWRAQSPNFLSFLVHILPVIQVAHVWVNNGATKKWYYAGTLKITGIIL